MEDDMTSRLASMTGFARSEGVLAGLSWAWELRSVNGRGLDLRFRLPNGLDAIEPGLREAAGRVLKRGNVTANLTLKHEEPNRLVPNVAALEQALALATEIASRIPNAPPIRVEALLALPGVLRSATASDTDTVQQNQVEAIRQGFDAALAQLVASRQGEGGRLAETLAALLGEISDLRAQAHRLASDQPAAQRNKLMENLRALLSETPSLPEERIAQEVAILATRCDVREELDRLTSHLAAAHALLAEGAQVGRRFDFLVQEFNRETNTVCSKSASAGLTDVGLRLKAAIEQLREQVQNIE
jgi:uncharacterized protein (TIGR00255 family)